MGVVRSADVEAIGGGLLKSALHNDIAAALPLAQLLHQKRWSEAASATSDLVFQCVRAVAQRAAPCASAHIQLAPVQLSRFQNQPHVRDHAVLLQQPEGDHSSEVNAQDEATGNAALHIALCEPSAPPGLIEALVKCGADVRLTNTKDQSALDLVFGATEAQAVALLGGVSADCVNALQQNGTTLLQTAQVRDCCNSVLLTRMCTTQAIILVQRETGSTYPGCAQLRAMRRSGRDWTCRQRERPR